MARGFSAGESRIGKLKSSTKASEGTVYHGSIPGIFGYGISATGSSKQEVMSKMRKKYLQFKKSYPDKETSFPKSYESWSGNIEEIKDKTKDFRPFSTLSVVTPQEAGKEAAESIKAAQDSLREELRSAEYAYGGDVVEDSTKELVKENLYDLGKTLSEGRKSELGDLANKAAERIGLRYSGVSPEQIKSDMASLAGTYYRAVMADAMYAYSRDDTLERDEMEEAAMEKVEQEVRAYVGNQPENRYAIHDMMKDVVFKARRDIIKVIDSFTEDR